MVIAQKIVGKEMKSRISWGMGVVGVWLALSGCAIHRVEEATALPQVEAPMDFREAEAGSESKGTWASGSWWESFEDPVLSDLIKQGLAGSFSLRGFVARIEQAEALSNQSGATLWPRLDLAAGADAEWDGEVTASETRDREDSRSVGGLLRWELDLWRRLSSAHQARVLQQEARVEDWRDARLLLSAVIAERYFEIKEQQRQLEVLRAQIEINESLLKLTTLRYGQGQASIVDVLQQREQLDETKARVPEAEARWGALGYSLDALLGTVPGHVNRKWDTAISSPPPLPVVGIPAKLLANRPDLRASRLRVMAIDYQVGEAVAAQFPSLRIGLGVDWRGDPGFGNAIESVFADLAGPLFAGGERRAEVRRRKAEMDEALAGYAELFLSAIVEVESSLLLERKLNERLVLVGAQLQSAQRLLTEARNRYSQGLTDYLPVFTSLNIVQNLEREIVSARRDMLSARVGLYRALGGPLLNTENHDLISRIDE
jgi:multidrug efflux system outer membrane protein